MGTTYEHTQLASVKDNGDVTVIYPINTVKDVSVETTNTALPSTIKTMGDFLDNVNPFIFGGTKDVIFVDNASESIGSIPDSEIDDQKISITSTWSSSNIVKNTSTFIPGYKMDTSIINKLYISPVSFNVDGRDLAFESLVPEGGRQWVVEYFPIVVSENTVEGNVGDVNTVKTAIQRWTGINFSDSGNMDAVVVYERTCTLGKWGDFVKIR